MSTTGKLSSHDGSLYVDVKFVDSFNRRQGLISSIFSGSKIEPPKLTLKHILNGNSGELLCIDADAVLNLCAASSSDGRVLVFDMRTGSLVTCVNYSRGGSAEACAL